jgi:hypothetical protein
MNRAALASVDLDARTYWYAPSSVPPKVADPTVRLLPNYDEYLIAYKDHSASFIGEWPKREAWWEMLARHIIVVNGYVAGGWRPLSDKADVRIEIKLREPLSRPQMAALRAEAQRYGRFIGQRVRVARVPS